MKPIRLVDPRVVLECGCGVALVLALLMPFFTVSAGSYVPVKAATSIVDAFPQEILADLFVAVALVALLLSVVRMLRASSGVLPMLLSLVTYAAAGALLAVLQLQWNDATSGWQMDAARFLGVDFSHSFGFWVYLGAAVIGGVVVLTELVWRPAARSESVADAALMPPMGVPAQSIAPTPLTSPIATLGSGRVTVVESGRPISEVVGLGETILLGRDSACRIRLADPRVSRRHASIQRVSAGWIVRDQGARNPTRLLQSGGASSDIVGEVHLASGQLMMGDALVTLHP
jgi:hypothetical protein